MFYTDFKKKEIFDNRQSAINSSRNLAKEDFLNKLSPSVEVNYEDMYFEICYNKISHDAIEEAYKTYLSERDSIFEVEIRKFLK